RDGSLASLAHWLHSTPAADGAAPDAAVAGPVAPPFEQGGPGWTEWQALPGGDAELVVIPAAPWRAAGLLLAGLVALLALGRPRRLPPVWRFRVHVMLLLALGLAVLLLPAPLRDLVIWPPLLVALGSFVW